MAQLVGAFGSALPPERAIKLFDAMLTLSDLPGKEQAQKMLDPDSDPEQEQARAQLEGAAAQLEMESKMLDNEGKKRKIAKDDVEIVQKQVETTQLMNAPADNVSVSV